MCIGREGSSSETPSACGVSATFIDSATTSIAGNKHIASAIFKHNTYYDYVSGYPKNPHWTANVE